MEYYELLEAIYYHGRVVDPRGQETKELRRQILEFNNYNFVATKKARPLEKVTEYLFAELCWYLSGDRRTEFIIPYAKLWSDIKNHDKTANSNYGELVYYRKSSKMTSFEYAYYNLVKDINTRRGTILYNDRAFNYEHNDYICTQDQQFFIRDNIFSCDVDLRSSDAIFGLQYNMPWWSIVHQDMLLKLSKHYPDLKLGNVFVQIKSSHIYKRHYKLIEKIINDDKEYYYVKLLQPILLRNKAEWWQEHIGEFIKIEKVG